MKQFAAVLVSASLLLALGLSQCSRSEPAEPVRLDLKNTAAGLSENFSGDRAYAHVEKIVGFGPRPPASDAYGKMLDYLEETLGSYGWTTTRQQFRAATPDGPVDFTNLLARHSTAAAPPQSLPFLIGGHIDTKQLPQPFLGANDGGSSTGVLLELARVLSSNPESAAMVELVFFDGEEAFRPGITPSDGLYGSKYFAHDLSTRPTWPAAGIILDIIGDPDHSLFFNPEAPPNFADTVSAIANGLHFVKPFEVSPFPILDDHVPLQNTGLECLHIIGDFGSMSYWHQPGDTLDKVKPSMLEKVGRLTLDFLAQVPARPTETP